MRLDRSLGLLLVSVCLGSATARAADPPGLKVLTEKGLAKSGTVYLIEDEKPVLEKLKEVKADFARYAQAVERQAEQEQVAIDLAQLQEQRAELQQQITMLSQQINMQSSMGAGSRMGRMVAMQNAPLIAQRNQMQAMVSQMNTGQNNLKAQLPQAKDKAAVEAEIKKRGETFKTALSDLRPMVDDVTKKYADLEADPSVQKAKHDVQEATHANIKLGPSDAFKAAARYLDQAERQVLGKRSPAAKAKAKTKAKK